MNEALQKLQSAIGTTFTIDETFNRDEFWVLRRKSEFIVLETPTIRYAPEFKVKLGSAFSIDRFYEVRTAFLFVGNYEIDFFFFAKIHAKPAPTFEPRAVTGFSIKKMFFID